jgi:hypothetical protein
VSHDRLTAFGGHNVVGRTACQQASIAPAQITINGFFILSPLITTARAGGKALSV